MSCSHMGHGSNHRADDQSKLGHFEIRSMEYQQLPVTTHASSRLESSKKLKILAIGFDVRTNSHLWLAVVELTMSKSAHVLDTRAVVGGLDRAMARVMSEIDEPRCPDALAVQSEKVCLIVCKQHWSKLERSFRNTNKAFGILRRSRSINGMMNPRCISEYTSGYLV